MFELDAITEQVLQNCAISDSRYAGLYSVCGLALRLRDLYKWEKGLDPWVEKDSSEILEWIGDKEEAWDKLEGRDFGDIAILDSVFDPFDTKGINAALKSHGLFYGAGYVQSLRPTFFLATLEEKREVDGCTVYILGRELARDLLTLPALSQDNCILIRKESGRFFLWDRIFFLRKSARPALKFALEGYGLTAQDPEQLKRHLSRISNAEMETYIYHELGEMHDDVFDRQLWRELVAAFPHSPVELLARSIKDVLADTNPNGSLRYIVRKRKAASLAFFVAFLDGMRRELFPELGEAFEEFAQTNNWLIIERAISKGYNTARNRAKTMSHIFQRGRDADDLRWAEDEIRRRLLLPLGVGTVKSQ